MLQYKRIKTNIGAHKLSYLKLPSKSYLCYSEHTFCPWEQTDIMFGTDEVLIKDSPLNCERRLKLFLVYVSWTRDPGSGFKAPLRVDASFVFYKGCFGQQASSMEPATPIAPITCTKGTCVSES